LRTHFGPAQSVKEVPKYKQYVIL